MPNNSSPIDNFTQTEDFRRFIENETLKIINKLAKEAKTDTNKIQMIAKKTIDLIRPGMSLEDLYKNAAKLDDNLSELSPLVYIIMRQYEEKYEKKTLDQVTQLVKDKHFDEAQNLIKKVIAFKVQN